MKKATWFTSLLLSAALSITSFSGIWMGLPAPVFAEEEYYEEEYNEEEYYEEEYEDSGDLEDSGEEDYHFEQDPTVDSNSIKGWPQGSPIDADCAVVMDADTGAILYSKYMDNQKYPASITKVMTVLLALENGNLEDTVKFSEYAVYSIEFGSAHLGLTEGEELTLEQCLYGIMLASANEISNAVAEYVAGDVDKFADMMNAKAAELGCTNTHFVNPNGLHDPDHYVSARDMALITKEALKYDKFREIINTDEYHYPPTNLVKEDRYFVNHHKFLMDESYDGIIGGKTGFTDQAFNTLVTCAERDGMTLVSVVLHAPGLESQYGDTRTILDYGFDNFEHKNLAISEISRDKIEILGIEDANELTKIKEADFAQEPFSMPAEILLTLPQEADLSLLTGKMDFADKVLTCYYSGEEVGSSPFEYTGVWIEETEPETEAATEAVTAAVTEVETEAVSEKAGLSVGGVLGKVQDFIQTLKQGFSVIRQLLEGNDMIAAIACGVLLIIFVPLLILAISRHIRYKKLLKLRMQEMEERRRISEEIERQTAEQVEAELRERDRLYQQEMEKRNRRKKED